MARGLFAAVFAAVVLAGAPVLESAVPVLGQYAGTDLSAQVVCGECESWWSNEPGASGFVHEFHTEGSCDIANGNGGGVNEPDYQYICARCGGTSECHDDHEDEEGEGRCHTECGPGGGELTNLIIDDLKGAVDRLDARSVVRVASTASWVQVDATARTVTIAGSCDGARVLETLTLPEALAVSVAEELLLAD